MKKYEDLSKSEKQKLDTYLHYVSFINLSYLIILLYGLAVVLAGYAMVSIFNVLVVEIIGIMFIAIGCVFVLLVMFNNIIDKKHLFLIFGYKNLYSDIFDIKKEDIKKVKIIRKIEWIKED